MRYVIVNGRLRFNLIIKGRVLREFYFRKKGEFRLSCRLVD